MADTYILIDFVIIVNSKIAYRR